MIFEQYYLQCLSHASYLVGDEQSGRAIVVDPQRDVAQYVADAEAHGLRIERVIETHVHADFLSGHLELAAATGAVISYGDAADAARIDYEIDPLVDGQRLTLGDVTLEILATPGHTPESISIVVYEHADDDVPYGVLTGDTLFVGDVGRPDLLSSFGVSADDLGRMLYDSLRTKLLPLPDVVRVYPAHGAGSACGKQLGTETSTTIGEQRAHNYALQPMSEEEFVAVVTDGQPTAPPYFAFDASLNRRAREVLDESAEVALLPLDDVLARQAAGAVVLDARDAIAFAAGHLAGSVNVGLEGRFAEYAGDVVHPDEDIVLVTEPGRAHEARVRLARIGFDGVVGALAQPLETFLDRPEVVERSSRLTPTELADRRAQLPALQIVDVRNPGEIGEGMIPGARPIPLARLRASVTDLDLSVPTVVYCAGGYRSIAGASLLREQGFVDVSDLLGGYSGWLTAEAGSPSGT
jgi:glyoxylase-like metal-dependent hydrolase (beta-lactamase superfamily II)/rhodanese-related sulfurtransferase